jgi:hypothetical protein
MAFIKDYQVKGFDNKIIAGCYWKITNIDFSKDRYIKITIIPFESREKAQNYILDNYIDLQKTYYLDCNNSIFETLFSITALNASDNNVYKASYVYLKTLDEFADAENVLEDGQSF